MSDEIDAPGSNDERLARLEAIADDQRRLLESLTDGALLMRRHKVDEQAVRAYLRRITADDGPILCGPWTGEIGFELLYWIPFLRWAQSTFDIDPARCIVMSRGGVRDWYRGIGARYVDAFDHVSLAEWRAETTAHKKQRQIAPFDSRLRKAAMAAAGVRRMHWMHPRLMYRLFTPVWQKGESLTIVDALTKHARLTTDPPPSDLPAQYVAMKWYFSTSFPDTAETRAFAADVTRQVARRLPVVLLSTELGLDEHAEYVAAGQPGIRTIAFEPSAIDNLAVQSRVIAGARAFIGTYGGFSYLAPLLGVPTVTYHANAAGFTRVHLECASRLFARMQQPFVLLGVDDVAALGDVLPRAEAGSA